MRQVSPTAITAPRKFKKAYGGNVDVSDPNQLNAITSSGLAATSLIGSVADAFDSGNSHGRQSGVTTGLKQGAALAATGAKIGGMFGPEGALIGAGVGFVGGAVKGLLGAAGAKRTEMAEDRSWDYNNKTALTSQGNAKIAADPSLMYGNKDAQNFTFGGGIDGGDKGPKRPVMSYSTLPASNDPYWKDHPLMTEHSDGTMRAWGERLPPLAPVPNRPGSGMPLVGQVPLIPPPIVPSDKSQGNSGVYYPGNAQQTSTAVPTIRSNSGMYKKGGTIHVHNPPTNNAQFSDYTGQQMFAEGGSIHIKKSHEGAFTEYKARTGKTTEEALHSTDPHVRKMANFAKNAAGWKKGYGGTIGQDESAPQTSQVPGGSLTPMASNSVQVNGQSHEQGGVQLPSAEVEGGESIANGFVFSKTLGFADLHKPIAKAIGKIEDKPMNPVRRQTLDILHGREQALAISQEFLKKKLGIPSDIE